jgi:hypothetical protein
MRNQRKIAIEKIEISVTCPTEGAHRTSTTRHMFANGVDVKGKRLVDLGAGHCIFSKIARDAGASVTAVDGRVDRLPPEEELIDIKFVQEDIRNFDTKTYDVKLVYGLLYHLELDDQLSLLKNCAQSGVTILDTQVHWPRIITSYPQYDWQKEIVKHKGYEGVVFPESPSPSASIGNPSSFWPTEDSLIAMIQSAGFKSLTIVDPAYASKYGVRRFMICRP